MVLLVSIIFVWNLLPNILFSNSEKTGVSKTAIFLEDSVKPLVKPVSYLWRLSINRKSCQGEIFAIIFLLGHTWKILKTEEMCKV